jgi:hypothetical protein
MNATSVLALISAISTALPTIENAASATLAFVQGAIAAVEQTGNSGDEKLAAVLNGAEVFFKGLGAEALSADFSQIAVPLEAAVNDIVAIYNSVGIFVKAVKAAL